MGTNSKKRREVITIKWYEVVVIVCMLLHSVLDIYAFWGPLSAGSMADLLVFTLCIISRKSVNKIPSTLWWYIGYRIFASAATLNSWQSIIPVGFILQVMALFATFRVVKFTNLLKVYKILGFVTTIFFVIQFISFQFLGVKINGVLNFLPLAIGEDDFLSVLDLRERQSSIFSEPAHFAEFLLPLLMIELFDKNNKRSILLIILCIFSLVFSMSGTGLLGLLIIGLLYLINHIIDKPSFKRVSVAVLFIIAIPVVAYYYSQSEVGEAVLSRTQDVKEAQNAAMVSSEYVRLFRGYDIYGELPSFNQIFGCGDKTNIIQKISHTKFSSLFDIDYFYFNGVSTVLLYTGLIGLIIYLLLFYKIWNDNTFCGRSIIVLLISFMLIGSIVLSATGVVLIFIACSYKKKARDSQLSIHNSHNNE